MTDGQTVLGEGSRRGIGLLIARLLLGLVFVWMGLSKTGLPQLVLDKTGLIDNPGVQRVVNSGYVELSNPVDFLKLIREYHILPENMPILLNLTAAVLPWLEVFCGLLLIIGVALRGTALMILLLMTFFTVMVTVRALNIYQADDIAFCAIKFDCGCGAGEVFICRKLPENFVLWLLALHVLLSRARRWCLKKELLPAKQA
ncbi:MAG: DoxX family membrane protein [Phycisphaerales bacterium]|nr:DoxX family membrane protein [Phycisphaerales bacterium]